MITGISISYLVSDKDVKMAFDTMHDSINTDGLLIFDDIDAEKLFNDFGLNGQKIGCREL